MESFNVFPMSNLRFFRIPVLFAAAMSCAQAEHVILSGGPALRGHEDYRVSPERHDRWWANFVRGATLRMELLRKSGSRDGITWMVYRKGYVLRGKEDKKSYVSNIEELAKKHKAKLVWIDTTKQFFAAMNSFARSSNKIRTFDYFGHSNQSAFMLDYSADILGVSTVWVHQHDLAALDANAFAPQAVCYSYGCYTGSSMSAYWHGQTGIPLHGCTGKTDFSELSYGRMPAPSSGGKWTY